MSENRSNDTGQISVAELLARNGQKVGTRAGGRRRRGASGGISVAELTGEIPVTRASDDKPEAAARRAVESEPPAVRPDPVPAPVTAEAEPSAPKAPPELEATRVTPKAASPKPATSPVPDAEKTTVTPRVAVKSRSAAPAAKPSGATPAAPAAKAGAATSAAPKIESPTEIIRPEALPRRARAHLGTVAATPARPGDASPGASSASEAKSDAASAVSMRKKSATSEPRLLSGPASDLQGTGSDEDDSTDPHGPAAPASGSAPEETAATSRSSRKARGTASDSAGGSASRKREDGKREDTEQGSSLKQWALLIGESVAAIVAGGLLFKGFERLWDLMPWVAFALALVVIVGLVALVRVLRRTDDITSQLIALAVGAFVSFGPLLFLLPGG
ncbi:hypothetical protein [Rhodococcus sp. CH91]|uniref:hypothetical protein n=1 Tax=Rhodococcus sp. CH91 TaxID=2910256 RepID=UPI001F4A17B6|nr:hypothetical protein [Rhodococcus sp. CH91]